MKIHDIICEDEYGIQPVIDRKPYDDISQEDDDYLVNHIKTKCQPWLSQTNRIAWRGIKTAGRFDYTAFSRKTRTDRRPRDSGDDHHKMYNALLAAAGSPTNRSNSMFITGISDAAALFGDVFACFPYGEFNYTWSPEYSDWTEDLNTAKIINTYYKFTPEEIEVRNKAEFNSWVKTKNEIRAKYGNGALFDPKFYDAKKLKQDITVDKDLDKALASGNEIMVRCDSYLLVGAETITRIMDRL